MIASLLVCIAADTKELRSMLNQIDKLLMTTANAGTPLKTILTNLRPMTTMHIV